MTSMILDFLERKENGTLLIQKKAKLRELFLSEVELTESKDGYIHFGDKVMIMNQGKVFTIYPTNPDPYFRARIRPGTCAGDVC